MTTSSQAGKEKRTGQRRSTNKVLGLHQNQLRKGPIIKKSLWQCVYKTKALKGVESLIQSTCPNIPLQNESYDASNQSLEMQNIQMFLPKVSTNPSLYSHHISTFNLAIAHAQICRSNFTPALRSATNELCFPAGHG